MSHLSTRSIKPVHLAAAVALVAAGTWGGTALAAGPDEKPTSAGTASKAAALRAPGPAYAYKKKSFTIEPGATSSATVFCPAGYKVSGGGVQTTSFGLRVNETRPEDGADTDSVVDDGWVSYVENPSASASSAVTWAVCAKL